MVSMSGQRQRLEQIAVDQAPEITADGKSECAVADQHTKFDVPVQGSLGAVRRGHEHRLVVGDDGLRMENPAGTFGVKRSRVVEHAWARGSGPVSLPEMIGVCNDNCDVRQATIRLAGFW